MQMVCEGWMIDTLDRTVTVYSQGDLEYARIFE